MKNEMADVVFFIGLVISLASKDGKHLTSYFHYWYRMGLCNFIRRFDIIHTI